MADIILAPAAELGGTVAIEQTVVDGQASAQRALSFPNIDLQAFDLVVFEQDTAGGWNPVASTVGVAEGTSAPDGYTRPEADERFGDLPTQQQHTQELANQAQRIGDFPDYVAQAIKDTLGQPCVVYHQGQVTRQRLDIFTPYTNDRTPHDLLELHGYINSQLGLRWMDYRVKGVGAVVSGGAYIAAGGTPRNMEIDGITFLSSLYAFESDSDGGVAGAGHNIRILNSPYIGAVEIFQSQNNGNNDRHTFINCNIGRMSRLAAYFGKPGHLVQFDRCTLGQSLTGGSVFDYYGPTDLRCRVTNSTIYLNAGVTLGRGTSSPARLQFVNCTLVYPDGTSVPFDNSDEESGSVVRFTKDADYPPIASGTFTVDVTGAQRGAVVFAELGASATPPELNPDTFELEGGAYEAGKRLSYAFRVASTGKIRYLISRLP
ncbi:MAG TPA: hypothetical protein VFO93_11570 [Hymenobacter sp.]|uniref:hypothetical protein n=1 Tax=Hymenobacter sp. TaxID=1898978 RepID=UPI002D800F8A|nr:hypothetical protein [Hymenobacter sp.]HET9504172.1 hypothetical protein [Hymenobacter sp.]